MVPLQLLNNILEVTLCLLVVFMQLLRIRLGVGQLLGWGGQDMDQGSVLGLGQVSLEELMVSRLVVEEEEGGDVCCATTTGSAPRATCSPSRSGARG